MTKPSFDLRDFKIPVSSIAPQEKFRTRQGDLLSYRFYPAWSEDLVILYHGVGGDSRYMSLLASALSKQGIANVVTPDFRCHGASLGSSDIIPPNQLEIDLEELIIHLKMQRSFSRMTLAGHSLGGSFTLRISVSELRYQFAEFVSLAPYLPPVYKASLAGFGGWIQVEPDGGFSLNYPEILRTGEEKTHYSPEFLKAAVAPDSLLQDLQNLKPHVSVMTGDKDEMVSCVRHKEIFDGVISRFVIAEGARHISLVSKADPVLSLF
ncbi:MAG: alpha/beta hydrolase [Bacillota bacterium]